MASTKTRSAVKGIIFESTGPPLLYLFTHEWKVVVGYTIARIILYFISELLWKKIKWGKCG